ncbi:MAG TPA: hypothetical protein VH165_06040 [Kofleriaceae bacterium]|nr:hypothetical protein [Kofleriaceae bacterium]
MGRRRDPRAKIERGDFQTPPALAASVCRVLAGHGLAPRSIVEPTCGTGSLLGAALDAFPAFEHALGIELDPDHVAAARAALGARIAVPGARVTVELGDLFTAEWPARLTALPDPLLVIGNPPWVTSADLGALQSDNLPAKANFHGRKGLDAVTGKSNFDISEWMVLKLLAWLDGRDAVLAMLCKVSVARKVLAFSWRADAMIRAAAMYRIDAMAHFGAAVEACLLVCELGPHGGSQACHLFDDLEPARATGVLGYRDGALVSDLAKYDRWKGLQGESAYHWRSGIKHDCAAVMELRRTDDGFENGDGEPVALEDQWLYPLCKSSDVARGGAMTAQRYLVVPQRQIGEDTHQLQQSAPRTWRYLMHHRARFDRRASTIYRGKPPFSIFGIGEYSFAPWKVAISGLYKKLAFRVIGPHRGKPVMFDDTCYFLACGSEAEAHLLAALLASEPATQFYESLVFWDAKRPITAELLRRLDLHRLAQTLGRATELAEVTSATASAARPPSSAAARASRPARTG